ncbi:MAG: aminodeoxychorismate lyase [Tistrella sp.]|uniref:Endolytic murein transglycosylase n=1 Tax=Tistrella mobilis TaxID=171437 RepID=A0A3B9IF26_9PROT|nr:endolytic transglycosylase MltG [Tistrella sp.]MAD39608.1 aminodeoxychorismate lyase [Tistrella sp.]MBA74163.1 aminodeoxychorismate lyase [Tistrella sp.]HAE46464.1 endolytic transglycosylase MltG [Tistrella mobilis]
MRFLKHLIIALVSLATLVVAGAGALLWWGSVWLETPGPLTEARTVLLPRGTGVAGITRELADAGAIDQPAVFRAAVVLLDVQTRLKAGEYRVEPGQSPSDIIDMLVEGRVVLHRLTLPEGITLRAAWEAVAGDDLLSGDMPPMEGFAEGALLPETYTYTRGDDRGALIRRMKAAMDKALDEAWAARRPDLPLSTPEEMLILASIVERETGIPDERPLVAGVFVNRLKRGMRLQSDPTVIYGLSEGTGRIDRGITRSDLGNAHDWNTYEIDGLPKTPIALPGRAALMAVAQPAETDALYFVADGTGGHVFARTLAEHNANVAKWRRIERERRRAAKAAAGD